MDVVEVANRHPAPQADEVGTAVAVVAVDDDAPDGHALVGRDLLAHVPDAARALLVGGERALVLEVGEEQNIALGALDRHGPDVEVLGRAVGQNHRPRRRSRGEDPVAAQVHGVGGDVGGVGVEQLLGEPDAEGWAVAGGIGEGDADRGGGARPQRGHRAGQHHEGRADSGDPSCSHTPTFAAEAPVSCREVCRSHGDP